MVSFLHGLDPILYWAVVAPIGIAVAAWALRMACEICSVEPPDFWQAVVTVMVVCIGNALLRYFLQAAHAPFGLGTQLVAPLLTTVVILSLSLSTGPVSAMMITMVQVSICGAIYMAFTMIDGLIMVTLVAAPMAIGAQKQTDHPKQSSHIDE